MSRERMIELARQLNPLADSWDMVAPEAHVQVLLDEAAALRNSLSALLWLKLSVGSAEFADCQRAIPLIEGQMKIARQQEAAARAAELAAAQADDEEWPTIELFDWQGNKIGPDFWDDVEFCGG